MAVLHTDGTPTAGQRVHALRVIVLSTNVTDAGIGEWGFSAQRPGTDGSEAEDRWITSCAYQASCELC